MVGNMFIKWILLLAAIPLVLYSGEAQTTESTDYVISLAQGGTARWSIENRFPLRTPEDTEGFRQYLARFEQEKAQIYAEFVKRIEGLVGRTAAATGRQMSASGFTISANIVETVAGTFGLVRYEFEWMGFARVGAGEIVFGDVFDGGLYLYERDSLVIKAPRGYTFTSVTPSPDREREDEVAWIGRRSFSSGAPSAELKAKPTLTDPVIITGVVAAAAVASVIILSRKRRRPGFTYSDRDMVVRIIREAGGALLQSEIVKRTGFSKSKTSELLSALQKNGLVEKVRRGREHLIVLRK